MTFFNRAGVSQDFLSILKDNGVNTVRLRLWHTPVDEHASFEEVKAFSNQLKTMGFQVWLTVHYSDSWADPGKQVAPKDWNVLSFEGLKVHVYNYTQRIMNEINPDIIQIGNEVDNGFLHPLGNIHTNQQQFLSLISEGIKAVRKVNSTTKIMIHRADPNNSLSFFNLLKGLDYDLIGISFYPQWHGKNLNLLRSQLKQLENAFSQNIVLAETSYPFSLGWVDQTNNVIGNLNQIISPAYPPTPEGQRSFLSDIKTTVKSLDRGVGICYWGAEWVAFEGKNAQFNGSPWENQALFDFSLKATPALEVFKD